MKNYLNFDNIAKFLFFIFPILIISGPFLSDLAVIIIDLWFINKLINFKEIRNKYIKNKIFYFFLIFNLLFLFSTIFSDYFLNSIKSSLFYFRFYLFAFAIYFILDTSKNIIKYFFISLSFSLVLIFFSAIYDFVFFKDFFRNTNLNINGPIYRVSGLFGDEWIMGGIVRNFFLLFVVFFTFLNYFKKISQDFVYLIFLLFTCLILLSGERSSLFTFILLVAAVIFFLRDRINIKKYFFISIIFFTIVISFSEPLRQRLFVGTYIQVTGKEEIGKITKDNEIISKFKKNKFIYLSIMHDAHARTALKMIHDKLFFGHGANTFRHACHKFIVNIYSCSTHPHNIYLQLISETGIFSMFFLLLILLFNLNILLKKNIIQVKIMSSFLIIYLIPFVPSGNFFNNYVNINLYLIVGIFLYFLGLKTTKEKL